MDEQELVTNAEASLNRELDNDAFWLACDQQLIIGFDEKAKRWLTMLEDPDPDDLIFQYMLIVRRSAYVQGYVRGVFDQQNSDLFNSLDK